MFEKEYETWEWLFDLAEDYEHEDEEQRARVIDELLELAHTDAPLETVLQAYIDADLL